jgi:hypothetical protein
MHRVVKEVLEKLVFACPRCLTVKRTYTEIFKHAATCEGRDQNAVDQGKILNDLGTPMGDINKIIAA